MAASAAPFCYSSYKARPRHEHHWLRVVHVREVSKGHVMLLQHLKLLVGFYAQMGFYQFSEFAAFVSKLFTEFDVHSYRFDKETQPGMVRDGPGELIIPARDTMAMRSFEASSDV
ncbi:hypothetical protein Bca52824_058995 [Brassica carinata]|uniref:Uncharacterized protein n=1 Tax=Brassica carinata TaxID=52824 RepID=A0A8X7QTK4_BRACI|nr:hypothetical protein Bca52824_058995 [Brassica carinata]